MKKNLIIATLFATGALVSASASAAAVTNAGSSTVRFTGAITDVTCEIDTGSQDQTVNLGTVGANSFKAAGDVAAPRNFNIKVVKCPPAVSQVSIRFDGKATGNDYNTLAIDQATDAATNVGIQITELATGKVLPLTQDSTPVPVAGEGDARSATIYFKANYVATAVPVTAGPANATATFDITYP